MKDRMRLKPPSVKMMEAYFKQDFNNLTVQVLLLLQPLIEAFLEDKIFRQTVIFALERKE
jgi:hypothetical protein